MTNNYDLEKIFSYVQKLEKRITKLESEKAIIVHGHLASQSAKSLTISLNQLINVYNDVSHILDVYAVTVSLSADSYRQQVKDQVILNQVTRGNYWVILLENEEGKNYYLLPNANIKLRIYRLKTISNLFAIKGENDGKQEEFTLIKPAKLEILSSGNEWRIKEKGELFLGKKSSTQRLVSELEKFTAHEDKIPASLQQLLKILTKINQGNSQLAKEIELLDSRLQKLEPQYVRLINLYYKNPQKFAQLEGGSQRLKVTKQTIKDFIQNTMNSVYLEVNEAGEYLLKKGEKDEYLFPDPLLIFDKMTLLFARQGKLFIIENEIPIAILGKDMKIKKPAKVRKNGDVWLLIESGEISL